MNYNEDANKTEAGKRLAAEMFEMVETILCSVNMEGYCDSITNDVIEDEEYEENTEYGRVIFDVYRLLNDGDDADDADDEENE